MIAFLLARAGNHTIRDSYLYEFPGIPEHVHVFNYEGVILQRELPTGCYVFTDLERVAPTDMAGVMAFYDHLGTLGPSVRRINHPARSMMRFELLRTLFERGINDFDVYRVSEDRRPVRYPVFLRRENDHEGPISMPLPDRETLDRAIDRAISKGHPRSELLIVEYCDVRDEHGLIAKYGACYVDGVVAPRHLLYSTGWVVKYPDFEKVAPIMSVEAQIRAEARYVAENPHADEIRKIFEIARIDYGRIDYSLKNGQIRVWEINTNPVIAAPKNLDGGLRHRTAIEPGVRGLANAILRLDEGLPRGRFPIDPPIVERLAARP